MYTHMHTYAVTIHPHFLHSVINCHQATHTLTSLCIPFSIDCILNNGDNGGWLVHKNSANLQHGATWIWPDTRLERSSTLYYHHCCLVTINYSLQSACFYKQYGVFMTLCVCACVHTICTHTCTHAHSHAHTCTHNMNIHTCMCTHNMCVTVCVCVCVCVAH